MQPLPGYQDLFPILPSFHHAPRLQIRAAFISPIAETPDIHTPSIRQHVMRSQNPSPVCAVHYLLTPLLGIPFAIFLAIGGIYRNSQWDCMPSPKGENPSTHNCFKTFAYLHDGAAVWSTWQARWKTAHARPLGLAGVVYGHIPTSLVILIRGIKRLLLGFPGAVQKKRRNKRSYFRT